MSKYVEQGRGSKDREQTETIKLRYMVTTGTCQQAEITKAQALLGWRVPFLKGDAVEVIILTSKHKTLSERYPLRGKSYQFDRPFDSVSEDVHVNVV